MIDVSASNLSVEWTAGGMVSTPADLVRFATALRDGRLLKPESLALMEAWGPARRALAMGQSLFRFFRTAEPLIGHNGSVLGFTGSLVWAEQGDVVIAVLSNVGTMNARKGLPTTSGLRCRALFPVHRTGPAVRAAVAIPIPTHTPRPSHLG